MTSGNDQSGEPGRPGQEPDWWQQGAQQPDSPSQQPGYGAQQADPTMRAGYTPPNPTTPMPAGQYGQQPYQGGAPYQSGPNPYPPTQAFGQPGYGQPGYGQQPPYGGPPPGYGQPYPGGPGGPPGGGNRKVWLFAGVGVLVVALIAAVVTVVLVNRNSTENSAKSSTTPSLISALTPTSTPAAKPTTTKTTGPKPSGTPNAVIPGYQVVVIPDNGAAYDIPPDWKIDTSGQTEFSSDSDSIPIAGLAQDGLNYCPNYVRTNAFLSQSTESDPAKAAADIGVRMGKIGWSTSTGATPGTAENFQSSDGQLQGVYLETKGTAPAPSPGCASSYSVYTFAFPGDNGAFVFTIAADTGVDKSVDSATAKKILASIRPVK